MNVDIANLTTARNVVEQHLGTTLSFASARSVKGWTAHELRQAIEEGRIIAVRVDGAYRFPADQFQAHKRRHEDLVKIARDTFAPIDPTSTLAASWLLQQHSPVGFRWRDLNAIDDPETVTRLVGLLAFLDAARYVQHQQAKIKGEPSA